MSASKPTIDPAQEWKLFYTASVDFYNKDFKAANEILKLLSDAGCSSEYIAKEVYNWQTVFRKTGRKPQYEKASGQ